MGIQTRHIRRPVQSRHSSDYHTHSSSSIYQALAGVSSPSKQATTTTVPKPSIAQILDTEKVANKVIPSGHDWSLATSQRFYLYHKQRCTGLILLSLAYLIPSRYRKYPDREAIRASTVAILKLLHPSRRRKPDGAERATLLRSQSWPLHLRLTRRRRPGCLDEGNVLRARRHGRICHSDGEMEKPHRRAPTVR